MVSIHFVRFRGKRIAYTTGHENGAIKKFIEHYHFNYLTSHELVAIRNVFGLREERYNSNYKPHKLKKHNEEEKNAKLDQF